ncbi:MAG: glycosyltransferase [Pedobacter sp.]|nr:MAG: glycosyltransferase [Pedobacter sp.]
MEDKKLISVIIPAYNVALYLSQCIENIKHQSYKNIEIIVVDDGSTDDTAKIAAQFDVKLIRQQNQGVSVARNTGIKNATGEYLHFMDPDDLISLSFYEEMLASSLKYDADVVFCGMINERQPTLSYTNQQAFLAVTKEDKLKLAKVGSEGYCFKYLFKTSFLISEKIEFDQSVQIAEDMIFSLTAVCKANKVVAVPNAIYYYKYNANSALTVLNKSAKSDRRKKMEPLRVFKQNFERENGIKIIGDPGIIIRYRFLGMPIFKKKLLDSGTTKWYLFGVCIIQSKAGH